MQVDIYSPSDIGSADVAVPSDPALRRVLLRFHLRGLEHWQFAYGDITVTGSLSDRPPHEAREAVRRSGGAPGEEATLPGSPYWMPARIVTPAGVEPGIPLGAGYIEVEAPPDYLARGGRFSLHWIDFYR